MPKNEYDTFIFKEGHYKTGQHSCDPKLVEKMRKENAKIAAKEHLRILSFLLNKRDEPEISAMLNKVFINTLFDSLRVPNHPLKSAVESIIKDWADKNAK